MLHHLTIVPATGNAAANAELADELAWDHTNALVCPEMSFGSNHFVMCYEHIRENYAHCLRHRAFIFSAALVVLQDLIASGYVEVYAPAVVEDATEVIIGLGNRIASGMMHLFAGEGVGWVSNAEWTTLPPELRAVVFGVEIVGAGDTTTQEDGDQ